MKLLLVHRYFVPDTAAYGRLLVDIADWLAEDGHEVDVLTAMPSYASEVTAAVRREIRPSGVGVERFRLLRETRSQTVRRVLNACFFVLRTAHRVFRGDHDLVMFATQPPVLLGIAIRVALQLSGRSGRYVYHVQDIHPEVSLQQATGFRRRALMALRTIEHRTVRSAARVITLSEDMCATLHARGQVPHGSITVINNHAARVVTSDDDAATSKAILDELDLGATDPLITFAGNLGRYQRLGEILTAFEAAHARRPGLRLLLLGEGPMKDALDTRRRHAGPSHAVHLPGHVSQGTVAAILDRTDLAIVSLDDQMLALAYPSKTMTYMITGVPILATTREDTSMGREVRDLADGVLANDIAGMTAAMVDVERLDPIARHNRQAQALERVGAHRARARWRSLFRDLQDEVAVRA